jgi:hypothetical protein
LRRQGTAWAPPCKMAAIASPSRFYSPAPSISSPRSVILETELAAARCELSYLHGALQASGASGVAAAVAAADHCPSPADLSFALKESQLAAARSELRYLEDLQRGAPIGYHPCPADRATQLTEFYSSTSCVRRSEQKQEEDNDDEAEEPTLCSFYGCGQSKWRADILPSALLFLGVGMGVRLSLGSSSSSSSSSFGPPVSAVMSARGARWMKDGTAGLLLCMMLAMASGGTSSSSTAAAASCSTSCR